MHITVLPSQQTSLFLIMLFDFTTLVSSENQGKYVGCFQIDKSIKSFIAKGLTPEQCITECYKSGSYYAGVRPGGECECYEEDPTDYRRILDEECNKVCENGYHCDRGSVYHTDATVGWFDQTLGFIGCYAAHAAVLVLNGFVTAQPNMTPYICIALCQRRGFMYAGLRGRDECLCGNREPCYSTRLHPSRCNQHCVGDTGLVCGGASEITVYMTGRTGHITGVDTTLALEGCYFTRSRVTDYMHYMQLSPKQCTSHCIQNNLLFAHLYNGAYCYCSNNIPLPHDKRPVTECSQPCIGDAQFICGGPTTDLIYRTSISGGCEMAAVHNRGLAYVGCYKDAIKRRLKGKKTKNRNMTPSMCIGTCTQLGFAYAGVQYSYQCFCGNEIPQPVDKVPEGECNRPCKGDSSQICGGVWRNSIYRTMNRVPGYDTHLNYYGCFEDSLNRRLKRRYKKKSTMTPNSCVTECKQRQYVYAGVQNGNQCFCGNTSPLAKDRKPETECQKPCTGDAKYVCGGWFRNAIYTT